jgi:hypothetical protein
LDVFFHHPIGVIWMSIKQRTQRMCEMAKIALDVPPSS